MDLLTQAYPGNSSKCNKHTKVERTMGLTRACRIFRKRDPLASWSSPLSPDRGSCVKASPRRTCPWGNWHRVGCLGHPPKARLQLYPLRCGVSLQYNIAGSEQSHDDDSRNYTQWYASPAKNDLYSHDAQKLAADPVGHCLGNIR